MSSANGYAFSSASNMRNDPQHQQTSDSRPKLFLQPYTMPGAYNQLMHTAVKYEPGVPYYPPPPPPVSSSAYQSTPNSPASSDKRSREDLNQKEKQRMFKLNDRINQLKTLLDEAGVQTKKTKQSILDNTSHYIEMLRGDLVIAQQKAERAEQQAGTFRALTHKGSKAAVDKVMSGVFQKTMTPRVVLDMDMKTVMFNSAFVKFTGLSEFVLKKKKTLRPYLCADQTKLDCIMKKVRETKRSMSALVKTSAADEKAVTLVAAVVMDDGGKATNVEFSLIPMETQQQQQEQRLPALKRQKMRAAHNGAKDSATQSGKPKEESGIYVQL